MFFTIRTSIVKGALLYDGPHKGKLMTAILLKPEMANFSNGCIIYTS